VPKPARIGLHESQNPVWLYVGQTEGRGKLEKHHQTILPQKSIFLYPLRPDFKEILTR
jgi:Domain of unknown function (DUF4338)